MQREEAIRRLKACEPALRIRGVAHLSLFGSVARGDPRPDSDLDVLIDLSPEAEPRFSLLDQAGIHVLLSDAFGRNVDVVLRRALRAPMRARVEPDEVPVF